MLENKKKVNKTKVNKDDIKPNKKKVKWDNPGYGKTINCRCDINPK